MDEAASMLRMEIDSMPTSLMKLTAESCNMKLSIRFWQGKDKGSVERRKQIEIETQKLKQEVDVLKAQWKWRRALFKTRRL